jgi:cytochrome c-type biogenesis protein CcmH/NrfG
MYKKLVLPVVFAALGGTHSILAQTGASPSPTPKISEIVSKNLGQIADNTPVPREKREQAYLKLLEGQRFIWTISRPRSQASQVNDAKQAKQALQKAIELDPTLAEAYTALAELSKNTPPYDIDEAILLANIAVKIDKNNFGGHQILAQLYTFKSQLNRGILNNEQAQKAIAEWKEIARLDPRNAEAYAFLSELYARTNNRSEGILALRKWVGAAAPIGNGFYGRIFQGESLLPENGSLKLGKALINAKQTREAIEILSLIVADNPDNDEAVEALQQAVESADQSSAALAIEALQQAVYTNSENASLVILLAQIQARSGKVEEAAKILQETTGKLSEKDKTSAAYLQVVLGDIYAQKERVDDAVKALQNALTIRGITNSEAVLDDERDFAIRVFDKMIEIYKKANRPNEARAVIERARIVLGKNDLFAEKPAKMTRLCRLFARFARKTQTTMRFCGSKQRP